MAVWKLSAVGLAHHVSIISVSLNSGYFLPFFNKTKPRQFRLSGFCAFSNLILQLRKAEELN
jgi:hypothetical protein